MSQLFDSVERCVFRSTYSSPAVEVFHLPRPLCLLSDASTDLEGSIDMIQDNGDWGYSN